MSDKVVRTSLLQRHSIANLTATFNIGYIRNTSTKTSPLY